MANYPRSKNRSSKGGGFFGLPDSIMDHPNFCRLSGNATKLLLWLGRQYNGGNNGDLSATWKQVKERGFKSESALFEARAELLHHRIIVISRYGGVHKPTLYALTWKPINECKGKLDIPSTKKPGDEWKEIQPEYQSRSKRSRALKINPAVAMRSNKPYFDHSITTHATDL